MSDMADRAKNLANAFMDDLCTGRIDEYESTREAREHLSYSGKASDQGGKLDATAKKHHP